MVGVSSSVANQNKVFLKIYLDTSLKVCAENSAQNLKIDFPIDNEDTWSQGVRITQSVPLYVIYTIARHLLTWLLFESINSTLFYIPSECFWSTMLCEVDASGS